MDLYNLAALWGEAGTVAWPGQTLGTRRPYIATTHLRRRVLPSRAPATEADGTQPFQERSPRAEAPSPALRRKARAHNDATLEKENKLADKGHGGAVVGTPSRPTFDNGDNARSPLSFRHLRHHTPATTTTTIGGGSSNTRASIAGANGKGDALVYQTMYTCVVAPAPAAHTNPVDYPHLLLAYYQWQKQVLLAHRAHLPVPLMGRQRDLSRGVGVGAAVGLAAGGPPVPRAPLDSRAGRPATVPEEGITTDVAPPASAHSGSVHRRRQHATHRSMGRAATPSSGSERGEDRHASDGFTAVSAAHPHEVNRTRPPSPALFPLASHVSEPSLRTHPEGAAHMGSGPWHPLLNAALLRQQQDQARASSSPPRSQSPAAPFGPCHPCDTVASNSSSSTRSCGGSNAVGRHRALDSARHSGHEGTRWQPRVNRRRPPGGLAETHRAAVYAERQHRLLHLLFTDGDGDDDGEDVWEGSAERRVANRCGRTVDKDCVAERERRRATENVGDFYRSTDRLLHHRHCSSRSQGPGAAASLPREVVSVAPADLSPSTSVSPPRPSPSVSCPRTVVYYPQQDQHLLQQNAEEEYFSYELLPRGDTDPSPSCKRPPSALLMPFRAPLSLAATSRSNSAGRYPRPVLYSPGHRRSASTASCSPSIASEALLPSPISPCDGSGAGDAAKATSPFTFPEVQKPPSPHSMEAEARVGTKKRGSEAARQDTLEDLLTAPIVSLSSPRRGSVPRSRTEPNRAKGSEGAPAASPPSFSADSGRPQPSARQGTTPRRGTRCYASAHAPFSVLLLQQQQQRQRQSEGPSRQTSAMVTRSLRLRAPTQDTGDESEDGEDVARPHGFDSGADTSGVNQSTSYSQSTLEETEVGLHRRTNTNPFTSLSVEPDTAFAANERGSASEASPRPLGANGSSADTSFFFRLYSAPEWSTPPPPPRSPPPATATAVHSPTMASADNTSAVPTSITPPAAAALLFQGDTKTVVADGGGTVSSRPSPAPLATARGPLHIGRAPLADNQPLAALSPPAGTTAARENVDNDASVCAEKPRPSFPSTRSTNSHRLSVEHAATPTPRMTATITTPRMSALSSSAFFRGSQGGRLSTARRSSWAPMKHRCRSHHALCRRSHRSGSSGDAATSDPTGRASAGRLSFLSSSLRTRRSSGAALFGADSAAAAPASTSSAVFGVALDSAFAAAVRPSPSLSLPSVNTLSVNALSGSSEREESEEGKPPIPAGAVTPEALRVCGSAELSHRHCLRRRAAPRRRRYYYRYCCLSEEDEGGQEEEAEEAEEEEEEEEEDRAAADGVANRLSFLDHTQTLRPSAPAPRESRLFAGRCSYDALGQGRRLSFTTPSPAGPARRRQRKRSAAASLSVALAAMLLASPAAGEQTPGPSAAALSTTQLRRFSTFLSGVEGGHATTPGFGSRRDSSLLLRSAFAPRRTPVSSPRASTSAVKADRRGDSPDFSSPGVLSQSQSHLHPQLQQQQQQPQQLPPLPSLHSQQRRRLWWGSLPRSHSNSPPSPVALSFLSASKLSPAHTTMATDPGTGTAAADASPLILFAGGGSGRAPPSLHPTSAVTAAGGRGAFQPLSNLNSLSNSRFASSASSQSREGSVSGNGGNGGSNRTGVNCCTQAEPATPVQQHMWRTPLVRAIFARSVSLSDSRRGHLPCVTAATSHSPTAAMTAVSAMNSEARGLSRGSAAGSGSRESERSAAEEGAAGEVSFPAWVPEPSGVRSVDSAASPEAHVGGPGIRGGARASVGEEPHQMTECGGAGRLTDLVLLFPAHSRGHSLHGRCRSASEPAGGRSPVSSSLCRSFSGRPAVRLRSASAGSHTSVVPSAASLTHAVEDAEDSPHRNGAAARDGPRDSVASPDAATAAETRRGDSAASSSPIVEPRLSSPAAATAAVDGGRREKVSRSRASGLGGVGPTGGINDGLEAVNLKWL